MDNDTILPCPLCGIEVEAGALTCPRCKSRMDAHPAQPFALADAFDAWDALGEEGATAQMALPFHTGIHTGPMPMVELAESPSPQGITQALDVDGLEEDEADGHAAYLPAQTRPRRCHAAGAVAAIVLMCAFLAGGAHLAAQANTLNQIDDARVAADIRADASFAQGSASADFVEVQDYAIDSVRLGTKETAEGGVDAHATVTMSNGYFSETRDVTVHYRKAAQDEGGGEDSWAHTCEVESHEVRPTRGILRDTELGIEGASPALDGAGMACTVEVPYQAPSPLWYAEVWGTRVASYAFDGQAWQRTGVEDREGTAGYQGLVGTYAQAGGASSGSWGLGNSKGKGQLGELVITWVDDQSGTFGGWFAYNGSRGLLGSSGAATDAFSGWIAEDGQLNVEADGQAGSIAFTASAAGDDKLRLDGTVYTQARGLMRESKVEGASFSVTVAKQSDEAAAMPQEPEDASEADAAVDEADEATGGAQDGAVGGDDEVEHFWDLWSFDDADEPEREHDDDNPFGNYWNRWF